MRIHDDDEAILARCLEASREVMQYDTTKMEQGDRPVLPYRTPPAESPPPPHFPLGTASLTLGLCGAIGIPIVDYVTEIPGYLQSPVLICGGIAGALAFTSGTGAIFLPSERLRGILGASLGLLSMFITPMIGRN